MVDIDIAGITQSYLAELSRVVANQIEQAPSPQPVWHRRPVAPIQERDRVDPSELASDISKQRENEKKARKDADERKRREDEDNKKRDDDDWYYRRTNQRNQDARAQDSISNSCNPFTDSGYSD